MRYSFTRSFRRGRHLGRDDDVVGLVLMIKQNDGHDLDGGVDAELFALPFHCRQNPPRQWTLAPLEPLDLFAALRTELDQKPQIRHPSDHLGQRLRVVPLLHGFTLLYYHRTSSGVLSGSFMRSRTLRMTSKAPRIRAI